MGNQWPQDVTEQTKNLTWLKERKKVKKEHAQKVA